MDDEMHTLQRRELIYPARPAIPLGRTHIPAALVALSVADVHDMG